LRHPRTGVWIMRVRTATEDPARRLRTGGGACSTRTVFRTSHGDQ
jgi:hypothetical protein